MDNIENLKEQFLEELKNVTTSRELEDLRVKYIGKKGLVTDLLKVMGSLSPEERPVYGSKVNSIKSLIEDTIRTNEDELKKKEIQNKLSAEKIDVTLPSTKIAKGSKHPLTRTIEEIEDLFVSMGYDVVSGPELETDEYCFERLNLPKGHPARDAQDSFYITSEYLLRTQTSAVQARAMMANKEKGPLRIIVPGKTFRREDDATHSHQFNQVEV